MGSSGGSAASLCASWRRDCGEVSFVGLVFFLLDVEVMVSYGNGGGDKK
jgi:hypothetical protein